MNRIILADTHGVFRTGVAKILSMEADCRVVAQCTGERSLQAALSMHGPALVVFGSTMDQDDPGLLMQQIRGRGGRGIAMLNEAEPTKPYTDAGVHGLFFRSASVSTLLNCVRCVGRGAMYLGQHDAGMLDEDLVGARARDRLTQKEMRIVALVVQGLKNKEVGLRLGTTDQVVKNYLRSVYDKIGVSDRLELTLFTLHHSALAEAAAAAGLLIKAA